MTPRESVDQSPVPLRRVGALTAHTRGLFEHAINETVDSLADTALAAEAKRYLQGLRVEVYEPERSVGISAMLLPGRKRLALLTNAFDGVEGTYQDVDLAFKWIVMHEVIHVMDHVTEYRLSDWFGDQVGSTRTTGTAPGCGGRYQPGNPGNVRFPTTLPGSKSVFEDLAESLCMSITAGAYMERRNGDIDTARYRLCDAIRNAPDIMSLLEPGRSVQT